METSRRGFLGFLAAAPLSARQAAAGALEAMQAGIGVTGLGAANEMAVPMGRATGGSGNWYAKRLTALKLRIPEFMKRQWWREAKQVRSIDPDLVSLRSVSLSMKVQMQAQRNYDHMQRRVFTGYEDDIAEAAWVEALDG